MKYYNNRIIAFVDILGFKDKVDLSVKSVEEAEKLHAALSLIRQIKDENDSSGTLEMKGLGVEITTFSDSAVISYPAKDNNLLFIILDLIHLQLNLAAKGVLIRGGLTVGELFHDGNIVYGPAMNKAYFIESKVAIYPRIVVDEPALEQYYKYARDDEIALQDIENLLRTDTDGLKFIDMLKQDQELNDYGTEYYEWLLGFREIIISGLCNTNLSVKMKYQWLQKYYNETVLDEGAYLPVPQDFDFDEQTEFRKQYESLAIR